MASWYDDDGSHAIGPPGYSQTTRQRAVGMTTCSHSGTQQPSTTAAALARSMLTPQCQMYDENKTVQ
jgi:hypothetical protein